MLTKDLKYLHLHEYIHTYIASIDSSIFAINNFLLSYPFKFMFYLIVKVRPKLTICVIAEHIN